VSADIESMLDFPDDELPQSVIPDILQRLSAASTEMNELLDTWSEGHILREGAHIVIAGAPNVGKSTLLNCLAGRDRAIVSPHPGTTRDTIEETITIQGYPIHLIDTAGLRDAPCEIEQEGIRRTHDALSQADLCICIVDASSPLSPEEKSFIESHKKSTTLLLLNKSDLGRRLKPADFQDYASLTVSLKQNESIAPILDQILEMILHQTASTEHGNLAISDRHKKLLLIAVKNVTNTSTQLKSGLESDFLLAATHVRSAVEQIGNIFGKDCSEELMNTIFSRFCVGK